MESPSNTSEVRSFKFIPNFATNNEPLRQLTCQKADFVWMRNKKAPLVKLRLSFSKLQYCRIFIRRSKPKLLLIPASNVWVLFSFKKTLNKNPDFQPVAFETESKLNEKH